MKFLRTQQPKLQPPKDLKIVKIKVKKSPYDGFLTVVIHTQAGQQLRFEIAHGLAWRVRHMIHKKLGFDEGEMAFGQRIGRWSDL